MRSIRSRKEVVDVVVKAGLTLEKTNNAQLMQAITAPASLDEDGVLARIGAICDEFECYGYRRVGAALRHQGVVVNGKKLRRLMRENDLQPKRRRRYVVTTDSNHVGPIDPGLAKEPPPQGCPKRQ